MSHSSIQAVAKTHVGKVRSNNEDSFYFDQESGVYAVADGMGGEAAGEVASTLAVEQLSTMMGKVSNGAVISWPWVYYPRLDFYHNCLKASFQMANSAIIKETELNPETSGMGTTMSGMVVSDRQAFIGHVGDSRLYLLRDRKLFQVTTDHTWVQEQCDAGLITEEEAAEHPYRNVITRALGANPKLDVDHIDLDLESGDIVLICSDGLNAMISDLVIRNILIEMNDLEKAIDALIASANAAGGKDNITVILVKIPE